MAEIDFSDLPDNLFKIVDYQALAAFDTVAQHMLGFISYGPIPLTEDRFDIYWIGVDPENGRHGTGTVLILEMEKQLRNNGSGHSSMLNRHQHRAMVRQGYSMKKIITSW